MAVSVKGITLWRREVDNRPGALARVLEPLARAGADLKVLMAYRYPGDEATAAAQAAGLAATSIPALLVQGDNRAGQAYAATRAIADAGISLNFFLAQVIGKRYSAVLGFETGADAQRAASLIKKARVSKKA